ncbi:hypothetical protein SCUP515_08429 [Seiridium cupressi]
MATTTRPCRGQGDDEDTVDPVDEDLEMPRRTSLSANSSLPVVLLRLLLVSDLGFAIQTEINMGWENIYVFACFASNIKPLVPDCKDLCAAQILSVRCSNFSNFLVLSSNGFFLPGEDYEVGVYHGCASGIAKLSTGLGLGVALTIITASPPWTLMTRVYSDHMARACMSYPVAETQWISGDAPSASMALHEQQLINQSMA